MYAFVCVCCPRAAHFKSDALRCLPQSAGLGWAGLGWAGLVSFTLKAFVCIVVVSFPRVFVPACFKKHLFLLLFLLL